MKISDWKPETKKNYNMSHKVEVTLLPAIYALYWKEKLQRLLWDQDGDRGEEPRFGPGVSWYLGNAFRIYEIKNTVFFLLNGLLELLGGFWSRWSVKWWKMNWKSNWISKFCNRTYWRCDGGLDLAGSSEEYSVSPSAQRTLSVGVWFWFGVSSCPYSKFDWCGIFS
jgi:hypothetical protein